MKKNIITAIILLLSIIILTSCSKNNTDTLETTHIDFCKKLSTCSEASIDIEDNKTKDIYRLSVLNKQDNICPIKLSLEKANTERFWDIEKLSVVCKQEWRANFEKISNFDEHICKRYIDSLMMNTLQFATNKDSQCTGELKDRLTR